MQNRQINKAYAHYTEMMMALGSQNIMPKEIFVKMCEMMFLVKGENNSNQNYNQSLAQRHFKDIKEKIPSGAKVTMLGLAYKSLSHITEESPGLNLTRIFANHGYRVVAHDPLAISEAKAILGQKAILTESLNDALSETDVIIVTTNDQEYLKLTPSQIRNKEKDVTFVDFWRKFRTFQNEAGINYIPIGVSDNKNGYKEKLIALWGN